MRLRCDDPVCTALVSAPFAGLVSHRNRIGGGPDRPTKLSYVQIRDRIDEIALTGDYVLVVFTGGECTRLGDDLLDAIAYANVHGLITRAVKSHQRRPHSHTRIRDQTRRPWHRVRLHRRQRPAVRIPRAGRRPASPTMRPPEWSTRWPAGRATGSPPVARQGDRSIAQVARSFGISSRVWRAGCLWPTETNTAPAYWPPVPDDLVRRQFAAGRPSAAGSNGSITAQTSAAISSRSGTASTCPKTPRSHLINTP